MFGKRVAVNNLMKRSATMFPVRRGWALLEMFLDCRMKIKTKTSFRTLFLKTRTQKSAGYDIAGLELKVCSALQDSKTERRLDCSQLLQLLCSSWLSLWLNSLSLLDQVKRVRWFSLRHEPKCCPPCLWVFSSLSLGSAFVLIHSPKIRGQRSWRSQFLVNHCCVSELNSVPFYSC